MEIGDTVYLKSDVNREFPMVILRPYSKTEWKVVWLDKKGRQVYDAFPIKALTKAV
jgi:hypothetical protein